MNTGNSIYIIGPSPSVNYIGGIATHIKNIQRYKCFCNAVFFDIGSLNSNAKSSLASIFRNLFFFRKKILIDKPSFILVNTSIYYGALCKLILVLAFLPDTSCTRFVFFHGGRFDTSSSLIIKLFYFLLKPFFGRASGFYFLSCEQLTGFKKLYPDLIGTLYMNYSPHDEILPKIRADSETLRLLFVGRIIKEKGVFDLLSAFETLTATKSVTLTIVGEGPDLDSLKSKVLPAYRDKVLFTGYLTGTALDEIYTNSDLLLLPSYHQEGFPYVAIEAMRAGLPIIATNSGALETLIEDGVTGYKVRAKVPGDIVAIIDELYSNRPLLDQMADNCQSYFKKFLSRTSGEQFYSSLVE